MVRHFCTRPGCNNIIEEDPTRPGPDRLTCSDACRSAVYRARRKARNLALKRAVRVASFAGFVRQFTDDYPQLGEVIDDVANAADVLAEELESLSRPT